MSDVPSLLCRLSWLERWLKVSRGIHADIYGIHCNCPLHCSWHRLVLTHHQRQVRQKPTPDGLARHGNTTPETRSYKYEQCLESSTYERVDRRRRVGSHASRLTSRPAAHCLLLKASSAMKMNIIIAIVINECQAVAVLDTAKMRTVLIERKYSKRFSQLRRYKWRVDSYTKSIVRIIVHTRHRCNRNLVKRCALI